jgi:8-amino-7-oxononanoate synthase
MWTKKYRKVRTRLLESATSLRGELKNNGFNTAESRSQIIPVIIGDSSDALKISEYLYGKGILAVAIRPPTVPAGTARIRISLTSEHTGEDISYLFENLKEATERILS